MALKGGPVHMSKPSGSALSEAPSGRLLHTAIVRPDADDKRQAPFAQHSLWRRTDVTQQQATQSPLCDPPMKLRLVSY